jgi:hypothetical protein
MMAGEDTISLKLFSHSWSNSKVEWGTSNLVVIIGRATMMSGLAMSSPWPWGMLLGTCGVRERLWDAGSGAYV